MGTEHALACHKCKTYVDGHKIWSLYYAVHKSWEKCPDTGRPLTWDEVQKEKNPKFNWYWAQRLFAFLWKHKDHGAEVEWMTDSGDRYYDFTKEAAQEFDPNAEHASVSSPKNDQHQP